MFQDSGWRQAVLYGTECSVPKIVPIPFLPSVLDKRARSVYDYDASSWIPELHQLGGVRSLTTTSFLVYADDGNHPTHVVFHLPLFYPKTSPANKLLKMMSDGIVKWRGNVLIMQVDGKDFDPTLQESLHVIVIGYVNRSLLHH